MRLFNFKLLRVFGFSFLLSARAFAGDASGPSTSIFAAPAQNLVYAPNCSILSETSVTTTPGAPKTLQFVDSKKALEMQQRYQDLNRTYELKQAYGLNTAADEQAHSDDVHNFAHYVYGEVRSYETKTQGARIQANLEADPTLSKAEKPAAFVGAGVSAYMGNPVKVKVSDDTKIQTITNVPHQNGQVALLSPYVTASVNVDLNGTDPSTGVTPERYRLNMSRSLNIWDLSSGVSYLGTSACLDTSISKRITPNLSASVDRFQQMNQDRGANNATVSLNYGIHF